MKKLLKTIGVAILLLVASVIVSFIVTIVVELLPVVSWIATIILVLFIAYAIVDSK